MKVEYLMILLLLSMISCQTKEELMDNFVKCVNAQIGKPYLEDLKAKGPSIFSNAGLIWYCRDVAGFPKISTIYISWRDIKQPKVGCYVHAITKENGESVSGDLLGVVVSTNPTMVVAGDPKRMVLTRHLLTFEKQYIRIEYHYVDF